MWDGQCPVPTAFKSVRAKIGGSKPPPYGSRYEKCRTVRRPVPTREVIKTSPSASLTPPLKGEALNSLIRHASRATFPQGKAMNPLRYLQKNKLC